MCNQSRRFHGKTEMSRAIVIPVLQKLQLREPVERNIQLKCIKPATVIFKPFSLWNIQWVKNFFPVPVVKTGTADMPADIIHRLSLTKMLPVTMACNLYFLSNALNA